MISPSSREPLVIVGSGGHARVVHDLVDNMMAGGGRWEVVGFLDDDPARHGLEVHGLPVLGGLGWLAGRHGMAAAIGVGYPAARQSVVASLAEYDVELPSLIDPRAHVSRRARVENGVVVTAGAQLASQCRLQAFSLAIAATVGHDADVGRFASVLTGVRLAGNVKVGEGALVGSGAIVIQGRSIGAWATVGAGSVVLRDIEPDVTALGNPARLVVRRQLGWQDGADAAEEDEDLG